MTRNLLLSAAEQVFARVGYEKAQVEQIAEAAGFSKGALYAHFKSKEDLFLALYAQKGAASLARLRHMLDSAPSQAEKISAFRRFYVDLSKDREWALIGLEVKLFARRSPQFKQRIQELNETTGDSINSVLVQLLGKSSRAAGEALGSIFSALVLETDLEPEVFSERKMRAILGTIFDALLGTLPPATSTRRSP